MSSHERARETLDVLHTAITSRDVTVNNAANVIAEAQVFATLALAESIDSLATTLDDRLATIGVELGQIGIGVSS